MNKNLFSILLEIIWLTVGVVAAIASINSLMHHDTKNGLLMALFSLIGFLMFYVRRNLRMRRKNENL